MKQFSKKELSNVVPASKQTEKSADSKFVITSNFLQLKTFGCSFPSSNSEQFQLFFKASNNFILNTLGKK
jgi:hypothetical protein